MQPLNVTKSKTKIPLRAVKVDARKRVIRMGDPTKPRWWRVNVGKRLTGTAKRRRFFKTEKEANAYIAEIVAAMREKGRSAFAIPTPLAIEAMQLADQLEVHQASLTEAVTFFLRHRGRGLRRTIDQLIPEYLCTKSNPKYRRAQEISLKVFAKDFGAKPIDSIFAPAIERWFGSKGWQPQNWRNYARDLAMFFRWAQLHDHVAESPMHKVVRPKVQRKAPEIFTVKEARDLLETAAAHEELGLLPMYAIAFFSGVRIEEIRRMRWEMIHWDEGEIRLPAEITKTGNPRNIEIFEPLRWWVQKIAPKRGDVVSSTNLRLRREKLFSLARVARKRNALRHSFATYHAAAHRDPGGLQLLLGQQTPSVLFRHYIAAVTRADANAFFRLRPRDRSGLKQRRRHSAPPRGRVSPQR